MSIDELNSDLQKPRGGRWVKLADVGDKVVGTLISAEMRNRTDPEGIVVLGKKSGEPRKIARLRIQTDERDDADDDGIRIFDANESARDALGAVAPLVEGGKIAIAIVAAAADKWSQATYQAQFKPAAKTVATSDLF